MVKSARAVGIAAAAVSMLTAFATSVTAQDENAFKAYFEGRRITLRMDMPGSADGVDIQVDPPRSIDYKKYRENLKRYGVAINSGDVVEGHARQTEGQSDRISDRRRRVRHLRRRHEHLVGHSPPGKTDREKTLEKRIKEETDKDRKRSLQRELDDLRDHRERENRILRAESERDRRSEA